MFFVVCCLLGFTGSQPIESPYLLCGRLLTLFYFVYFLLIFFFNKNSDYIRDIVWEDKPLTKEIYCQITGHRV